MNKINEIFYSLQGEGTFTGSAAVFVRYSGCNLKCDFCDTAHQSGKVISDEELIARVCQYPTRHVIFTGGEPTLFLKASILKTLHERGKFIHVETNGTIRLDDEIEHLIDWITCSPKNGNVPQIQRIDELKIVFDMEHIDHVDKLDHVKAEVEEYYLQPCDRADAEYNRINTAECINYIKTHPKWKLSLQTHKMLGLR